MSINSLVKWYTYHDPGPGAPPESPFPDPCPSLPTTLFPSVAEIASLRSTGRLHCFRVAPSGNSFFSNSGSIRMLLSSNEILLAASGGLWGGYFCFSRCGHRSEPRKLLQDRVPHLERGRRSRAVSRLRKLAAVGRRFGYRRLLCADAP
jgi:hypothetical protein